MTELPPLPDNVGKKRSFNDIKGNPLSFTILDEIRLPQTGEPTKVFYLQLLEYEGTKRRQLRLAYYIIGEKPAMRGRWVWGQFNPHIPAQDLLTLVEEGKTKGFFE
jgi:hypothetical protein